MQLQLALYNLLMATQITFRSEFLRGSINIANSRYF
jgi:hypothetical protein